VRLGEPPASAPIGGRTAVLTGVSLVGFAANSLLCRMALEPGLVDAPSFTSLRLAFGALALALIVGFWKGPAKIVGSGSWPGAFALFAYALSFSLAYLRLGAGVGALVLFGAVQATMILSGVLSGERPRAREWMGLGVAVGGLALLALPGATAPDPLGLSLMVLAGASWGGYSLLGRRRSEHPLAATSDNFIRTLPLAALLSATTLGAAKISLEGAVLAVISGAVTSGLVYAVWYTALPGLSATRAAIVQLAVPVLAVAGGVVVLSEVLTARLAVAGCLVLGGVALAVTAHRRATGSSNAR
jgi:drug/metabolite transporter (DMT)-like permease